MGAYYTHTLKADYPIQVSVIQGPDTPAIRISTTTDLYLRDTITAPADATISLISAGDISFGERAAILGASPEIQAGGSLRANVEGQRPSGPVALAASPASLMGPARLAGPSEPQVSNFTAEGDIEIWAVYDPSGNQSSTIIVGQIISTGGNVILHAREGIQAHDSASLISGNQVELRARDGGIGTAELPLRVDSDLLGTGGVAAKASGDIYLRETTGDLKLTQPQTWEDPQASIQSELGSVFLYVDLGSIVDAYYEELGPRTQEQIDESAAAMQLTGDAARQAAVAALRSEQGRRTQLYHDYWRQYRRAEPTTVATEIVISSLDAEQDEVQSSQLHGLQTGDELFFRLGVDLTRQDFEDLTRWQTKPDHDLPALVPGELRDLRSGEIVRSAEDLLYRYLGEDRQGVDLRSQDFGNIGRWVEIAPEYDLHADYDLQGLAGMVYLDPGQQVRTLDGRLVRYLGTPAVDVELSAEDFNDSSKWFEIRAASGEPVKVTTGMLVETADRVIYQYLGANATETNLNDGFAYFAVVTGDRTFQLASSRYDAAIGETPVVVDLTSQPGADLESLRLIQYDYHALAAEDPQLGEVPEQYQEVHQSYGAAACDSGFVFQFTQEEWNQRIAARTFSADSLGTPVAPSLFNFLYPAAATEFGATAGAERPNIAGQQITLVVAQGKIGRVEAPLDINLVDGFENLPQEQRQSLAIATPEDVVAVDYAVYQYQGPAGQVDLVEADFSDPTLWEKQTFLYSTTRETQVEWVEPGDLIQVTIPQRADGGPQFGVYRFVGVAATSLDLSQQDYGNRDDWFALAEFDASEGEKPLSHGAYVGRIEGLTIEIWNDVDLQTQNALQIVSDDAVSIASPGDLPIGSIIAGGAIRLRALGNIRLDATGGASITSARESVSLQAGGDVWISSESQIVAQTMVAIAGDFADSDPGVGGNIQIHGLINAGATKIMGAGDSDTIFVANLVQGSAWKVLPGAGDDQVSLGTQLNNVVGLWSLHGGDGADTYRLSNYGETLDLPSLSNGQLIRIEGIDLTGSGGNTLVLEAEAVMKITGSGTLSVRGDSDDRAQLGSGWTMAESQFIGTDYFHVLTQGAATVRLALHPWQNPIFAVDVSGNGLAEPLDVLQLINWINGYGTGPLTVPPVLPDVPPAFVDVNGNDIVEPLDVLRVINHINEFGSGPSPLAGAEGESALVRPPAIAEGESPIFASLDSIDTDRIHRMRNSTIDEHISPLGISKGRRIGRSTHAVPDGKGTARESRSSRFATDTNEPRNDAWDNLDWLDLVDSLDALANDVTTAWGVMVQRFSP